MSKILPSDSPYRPILYSRPEAAIRGRMSVSHLDRLVKRGVVPFVRDGRKVLFPCDKFDYWCVNRDGNVPPDSAGDVG